MFKAGELIKRKDFIKFSRGYCMVVGKDRDNYTIYNNSTQVLKTVACFVIDNLYTKHA
jgi:hypothetical protein